MEAEADEPCGVQDTAWVDTEDSLAAEDTVLRDTAVDASLVVAD